jgi:hypothetical protein
MGFPHDLRKSLARALATVLDALDVRTTLSTWDFIVADGPRIALVEGQLRPSGNHVMELYERASGLNPFVPLFDDASGIREIEPTAIAAVVFPSPATPLDVVERVDVPADVRCAVSIDDRVYSRFRWAGPDCAGGSFIRLLATADSVEEVLRVLTDCARRSAVVGRDSNGNACSTPLVVPEFRFGTVAFDTSNAE